MSTEIEVFDVREATTEGKDSFEIDAQTEDLIESLGLEGQKSLIHPQEDSDISTINPYRLMTAEEREVYSTLYPERTPVDKYSAGLIPLRVLQVIAHAKHELGLTLEIWGPRTKDTDPVLVANKPGSYREYYLLARWGEALEPFADLRDRAIEVLTDSWVAKAKAKISECQQFANREYARAKIFEQLNGNYVHLPF